MGHKKFLVVLFLLACVPAWSQVRLEHVSSPQGHEALVVENRLARYTFWSDGGVLASVYLYFAPYGTKATEVVPGWDKKELLPGVSLPLEIELPGEGEGVSPDLYEIKAERKGPGEVEVRLSWQGEGLTVEKRFSIADKAVYLVPVEVRLSGEAKGLRIILGHIPTGSKAPRIVSLCNGKPVEGFTPEGTCGRVQGIGLVDAGTVYFWQFPQGLPRGARLFHGVNRAGQPVFGLLVPELSGGLVLKTAFYGGRNRYVLLEKVGLSSLIKLNVFGRFMVGVIHFLQFLYRATGNYGWAIIIFTIVAQIFLFPLTRKQIHSMAKLQRLQPKIQKLQEMYKDDRETLQKQMIELYRTEKVNPLGGCLPFLLQFPFLILLWRAIFNSAELFHLAPRFLWIPDLSLPDPYYIIIALTVGVQLLGQWLSIRRIPGQKGQGVGWVMPILFGFLFRNFPAGLWLYYFIYSIIQSTLQAIVYWELSHKGPAKAG